ncbi:TatD family hydrolase [Salinimonas marina]|uniref:TatD family hydrolase n=1 Tax=Salinimonas marina TaxID=2785918 RepID=A0A7S9DY19_9ALTE|nr:TatD family hydrolase [Salinimonas marina]QPG05380.1 TatD family hydrolase [Salinimonas marina]
MRWFDAGVNLLDARFDADAVIEHARQAGVERLCMITTAPGQWQAAAELYQRYPKQLCYTVGVHPHHAKEVTSADLDALEQHAQAPGVVAIGECGLDYNRNFSPPAIQREVFAAQLTLAARLNMPVYLHEREAFDDQLALLQQTPPVAGIAHCFTGTCEQMQAYVSLGLYIGITGWLCDPKRGEALRGAVTQLPLDRLVLETDAPYLFPKNQRPRKRNNEPAFIGAIATRLAEILDVSEARLSDICMHNTTQLFKVD